MTKSTSGGCDQFDTSLEAIDQELRTAFCERRQTDRLKTNYRIDYCYFYNYYERQSHSLCSPEMLLYLLILIDVHCDINIV